ncbi:WhiB family transcriptional regulator [Mycobacterium sp.]|uniref:WhiB family transcriptional regulator n=1 Tax=Mycobacterium sp. TaxID=1785 RepID=UPI002C4DFBC9|nr:WhiB family transcriptional regulator [Mycobacterium sp.]HME47594.1 WhiB family transcriptional regulator [Mycobacterium sp.]
MNTATPIDQNGQNSAVVDADAAKYAHAKCTILLARVQSRIAELAATGRLDPDHGMTMQRDLTKIWSHLYGGPEYCDCDMCDPVESAPNDYAAFDLGPTRGIWRSMATSWFKDDSVGGEWPSMFKDRRRNPGPPRDWLTLVGELLRDTARLPQARCRSVPDPSIFTTLLDENVAAAAAVCSACPEQLPCRRWAQSSGDDANGVLGGHVFLGGLEYSAAEWLAI